MTKRWQDELKYCAALVKTKGNDNVPHGMVIRYLSEQVSSATAEKEPAIAHALSFAIYWIRQGRWDRSERCIDHMLNQTGQD